MSRKTFTRILIVAILVTMFAFPATLVAAQAAQAAPMKAEGLILTAPAMQDTPTVPDLRGFLQWLIGGGGAIMAVSWLLERMKWFQALSPDAKDYTVFGASAVIGCGALAVITYVPTETLEAIGPYFLILATVFVMVFIAKTFHKADRLPS